MTGALSSFDEKHLSVHCWPDADLNGDSMHTKSTGGLYVEIQGLEGRAMPVSFGSNKHTATSLHTPESELVTLAKNLRNAMLPVQSLMQHILGRPIDMIVHEDNEPCIAIVRKGYSPSMRCLPRTHRTSIGVCHETFHDPIPEGSGKCNLIYTQTSVHKGDLMTKYLDAPALGRALDLIGVRNTDASK